MKKLFPSRLRSSAKEAQAFNPLSSKDIQLFKAMVAGEPPIRGLSNADKRMCLQSSMHLQKLTDKNRGRLTRSLFSK
jgi:hypothetical protein